MKIKFVGRIWLVFLVFCLVTSMSLIQQDGNIVVAQPVSFSYDFEDTCLTCQIDITDTSEGWINSTVNDDPFYVDNNNPYTGARNFYITQIEPLGANTKYNGDWNYFYSSEMMITNWSAMVRASNGYTTNKRYAFDFVNETGTVIIRLYQSRSGANNIWGYLAHNSTYMDIIVGHSTTEYLNVSWEFIDNETVEYYFDQTMYIGTPTTLTAYPRINKTMFRGLHTESSFVCDIDDINITTYFGFSYEVGDVTINVFNESDISDAITGWHVYVKNSVGGLIYSSENNNNGFVITLNLIGFGERLFEIYADGYYERYYYVTTVRGANHTLNAYLPPTGEAYLYYIKVQASVDQPIYQAYLEISRNFNGTVNDTAQGYTDVFGLYPIYLIGGQQYGINISATGYDTFRGTFITDPNCYGYDCPIVFTLGDTSYNETVYTLGDVIHFNATINSTGHIQVWYEDFLTNTTNTNITIYQYYNGTFTNNYSEERTGDNSFTFISSGYNTSMMHYIELHVNHTNFEPNHQIMYILLHPLISGLPTESTLEDRWIDVFGNWELGWVKTFLVFIPCIFFLVAFGPSHAGLGVLSSGLYLGFTTLMIDFGTVVTATFIAIATTLAAVGFILIITKTGRAIV